MAFDWKKFHDVGVCLTQFSDDEEYQRSAISRFYYSCFHLVKKCYEDKQGYKVGRQDTHKTLINYLNRSNEEKFNELGVLLRQLRVYRNNADYDDSFRRGNRIKSEKSVEDIFRILGELGYC